MLATRCTGERHLALDLLAHSGRNADLFGLGMCLQARRDVDTVAEQIVTARHHVAQIEADPELHPPVLRQVAIAARGHALDRHRAAHRLHRAGELGHDPVAGEIEDPALVLGHQCGDDLLVGRQRLNGPVLVQRHQPAVADDVRRKDDRETTIGFLDRHRYDLDSEAFTPFCSTTHREIWRGANGPCFNHGSQFPTRLRPILPREPPGYRRQCRVSRAWSPAPTLPATTVRPRYARATRSCSRSATSLASCVTTVQAGRSGPNDGRTLCRQGRLLTAGLAPNWGIGSGRGPNRLTLTARG